MNTQAASSSIAPTPRPVKAEAAAGQPLRSGDAGQSPADQGFAAQLAARGEPSDKPAGPPNSEPASVPAAPVTDTALPPTGKELPSAPPLLPPGLVKDLSEQAAPEAALHKPSLAHLPVPAVVAIQKVSAGDTNKLAKAAAADDHGDEPAEPGFGEPATSTPVLTVLLPAPSTAPVPAASAAPASAQPPQAAPIPAAPLQSAHAATHAAGPQQPATERSANPSLPADPAAGTARHSVETIAALAAQRAEPAEREVASTVPTAATPSATVLPVPREVAAAQAPGTAPADLAQVIDAIARARAEAQPQTGAMAVHMAVRHAEFGAVSLHFQQDGAGLSVAMTSPDPDFARAVSAAVPMERPGTSGGDNAVGQQRFAANANARDEGHTGTNSHRNGESGGRQPSAAPRANAAPRAASDDQPRNGIFA